MQYKLPLVFEPQPEGGYTVTSPILPELVTEGDSLQEALENVSDALDAVIEIYQDTNRELPLEKIDQVEDGRLLAEVVISVP